MDRYLKNMLKLVYYLYIYKKKPFMIKLFDVEKNK